MSRSELYKLESLELLIGQFQQVPRDWIEVIHQANDADYTSSFHYLLSHFGSITISSESKREDQLTDPILCEEVNALWEFLVEQPTGMADSSNASGYIEIFTCECCFDDSVPVDWLGQCTDGHVFCMSCITQYATEQVFGNNQTFLRCMSVDRCSASYPKQTLDKLPENIMKTLVAIEHRESIEAARIPDIHKCPKCAFLFQCEIERIQFPRCPNPQCEHEFCLWCEQTPHHHLTCEEARAADKRAVSVNTAAEAMTEAVKRVCPNPQCKMEFVKMSGCNKITCSRCKTLSCYCCRKKLDGGNTYSHFCQVAHCTHGDCGKCRLYTDSEAEDNAARRRAGEALYTSSDTDTDTAAAVEALLRL